MKIPIYQVDAFANEVFKGNPAAICPLDTWLEADVMQAIANENNLAETAFFVNTGDQIELRWFTPEVEVDLCGHATLASAYVLFKQLGFSLDTIPFYSRRSGKLPVRREGDLILMNFPSDPVTEVELNDEMISCFNLQPASAFQGKSDLMVLFENEDAIRELKPDFFRLNALRYRGVIATAQGQSVDFVSRFFAPQVGINEDPVTGSAHTTLTPFWSTQLGKTEMKAKQLSKRGGDVLCRYQGERVEIGGYGKLYMIGEIEISPTTSP